MPALSLDHWNVYCKDLKATVKFYERYVGLKNGDRPPFNFPGAWLYAGEKPILQNGPTYLCRDAGCWNLALERGALGRALEAPVPAALRDALAAGPSTLNTQGGDRGQE